MQNPIRSRLQRSATITSLLMIIVALSAAALAQESPTAVEERVVRVVGHGVVYGQPDVATVELGVTATDPDAAAAVEQIDQRMREVLDALSQLGVPEQSIRTTAYNIWREEQFPREGQESTQAVFRAQHMVAVELDGARRAGEVLAAAVDAGANAVGGISFSFSNPAELEAEARAMAVEDARSRASQLAEAAGLSLGEPLVLEEVTSGGGPIPYYERAVGSSSAAPISPGQLSVEARVAVTFAAE